MSVVAGISLVLNSSSVDSNASSLLLWSLVDFTVLDVFGSVLGGKVLGDSRSEGGLAVVNVPNRTD